MITKKQIKEIHTLKGILRWDNDTYRYFLEGFGAESCTELSERKASEVIRLMHSLVEEAESDRKATPKQVSYIRYLWLGVDFSAGEEGDRLLSNFLKKKYKASKPEELTRPQAQGAIAAIKRMKARPARNVRTEKVYIVHNSTKLTT